MILKTHMLLILLPFFLLSCARQGHSRDVYFVGNPIEIRGFSEDQLRLLKSTISRIKLLKPAHLKINKKTYQRLSQFESLFGFPFDGEKLTHWLLARIRAVSYRNTWTVAINQNKGFFVIGDNFFSKLTDLERLYLFVHEARHSDDGGYKHIKCPEGFRFISSAQSDKDLEGMFACDGTDNGAYAFQAAFLFELFAYGIFDQREVGLLYNSSISRIVK